MAAEEMAGSASQTLKIQLILLVVKQILVIIGRIDNFTFSMTSTIIFFFWLKHCSSRSTAYPITGHCMSVGCFKTSTWKVD